ncbi:unnamed protein product [Allacma fusca]|uniref:Uncharacterized protein n=1 Tax=Allacma fusca TaxID=39272 RepID=A0A8J2KND2_9HEXA|nr:unnamed protein product [Allacma fusca]
MEAILKDLIDSTSKHKESVPRQFYFNLSSSSRNWNEPTSFHLVQRLKHAQAYLQKHFQECQEFQSRTLYIKTKENEKEILTSILALDIYHNCPQLLGNEEPTEMKSLLAEFITPLDGISMQDFFMYKNSNLININLTSLAISVLLETGNLAEPPARTIAELLKEEMLKKFQSISEDSTENCDINAVECCNLLRLLYQLDMSGNVEEIQDFLYAYLDNRIYEDNEDSINISFSPDAFLYFLTRAVVCYPSAEELFRDLLLQRIFDRLGQGFGFEIKEDVEACPAIDSSMRLVSLHCLGILHEDSALLRRLMAGEVKMLLRWQQKDGSWGLDRICKIEGNAFGGTEISSLFAMFALSFICEYK